MPLEISLPTCTAAGGVPCSTSAPTVLRANERTARASASKIARRRSFASSALSAIRDSASVVSYTTDPCGLYPARLPDDGFFFASRGVFAPAARRGCGAMASTRVRVARGARTRSTLGNRPLQTEPFAATHLASRAKRDPRRARPCQSRRDPKPFIQLAQKRARIEPRRCRAGRRELRVVSWS